MEERCCRLEGQDVVVVVMDDRALDDDVADDLVVTPQLVDQVFPSGGEPQRHTQESIY